MSFTSAGTISPFLIRMMSPGTRSRAATFCHFPSRSTRASSASCSFSMAMAFPAWYSCQKPTTALMIRRANMIPKSSQRPMMADMTTAASIIQGIGPQK